MKIRDKRISPVPVTQEELKKFKALAEARHTKLTEVIRQLLHREADAQRKEQEAA